MRKLAYIFLFLSVASLVGCLYHFEHPYFAVPQSGLNWVVIRQLYVAGNRQHINLRIDGNGIVVVKEGTSPLVINSFAHNTDSAHWDDIREHRFQLPPEETNMIFQNLVNSGLFVKRTKSLFSGSAATNETSFVFVSANIRNKTAGSNDPITDPELLDALKMTVKQFYRPRPAQRKPISQTENPQTLNERIP